MLTAILPPVSSPFRDRFCGVLIVAAAAMPAAAQELRVPYVPTPQVVVDRMLEIAKVGPDDYLIDLGSGDGRIVITAAKKFGTRGFGVDIDPERIGESNDNARQAGVADRVAFYQRDLFETSLDEATVITMYLRPQLNLELRPRLLALKPGTRIVSHDFSMDTWQPDQHVVIEAPDKFGGSGGDSDIYFWVVPAQVAGRWRWSSVVRDKQKTYEVFLRQHYQMLSGTAQVDGRPVKLDQARVKGNKLRLEFTADIDGMRVTHALVGKVNGNEVFGRETLSGDGVRSTRDWTARRAERSAVLSNKAGLRQSQPSSATTY